MSTTTANMSLTLPALNGDPGVWDSALNASLTILDAHTHQTGSGVPITSAAINIDAALTFAGFAATNLKGTSFTPQSSSPGLNYVWVKTSDNELYFSDELARDVKLTSNGAVNIAAVGGIVGDYASAAAAFYYDNAAKSYLALQAAPAPNVWASVSAGEVDIYEKASGIATRVRLASPAALAASYQVTFPAALPGSTLLTQVSSTGVMTWSNTIVNAVTFSDDVTLAANQNLTLSGTGEYKHGDRVMTRDLSNANFDGSIVFLWVPASFYANSTAAGSAYMSLPLLVGDRVKTITARIYGNSAVAITVRLVVLDGSGSTVTNGGGVAGTVPGAAWTTSPTTDGALNHTVAANQSVYAFISVDATGARVQTISVTYDHP